MEPEKINPRNFNVKQIVYKDDDFAVAYGKWENKTDCLAMRWNGYGEQDAGYPKTFGKPVWFIVPETLTVPFVKGMLENKNADNQGLLEVLNLELGKKGLEE